MINPFALPLPADYRELPDEELDALCRSNTTAADEASQHAKPWRYAVYVLTLPTIVLALTNGRGWWPFALTQWSYFLVSAYYTMISIRLYKANRKMYDVLIVRGQERLVETQQHDD